MSSTRKYLTSALACTLLFSASCRRTAAPVDQTAPPPQSQDSLNAQGGTTSAGETKYFKGSIGSALGLQMKLVREAGTLRGSYFYQKVGTKIDLRGTIDSGNNFTLEEFDAKGTKTGVFSGLWKPDADGLIELAGNWNKPDSDKKTAFSLHEEPISFTGSLEIVAKQIKENNKKLRYQVDAEYPQLTGGSNPNAEKFNQLIRGIVTRKVAGFRKDMVPEPGETDPNAQVEGSEPMASDLGIAYTVAFATDDLISIDFNVGSYYSGAAHPNSYSETVNYDLKNGKSLQLIDLFNSGAKYLQTLSSYSIADLKKQSKDKGSDGMLDDDWIKRGAGASPNNYKSWTITRKGLVINFDSYQVAPYAAGPQRVVVPYSAIKDIVKADGPLGPFMKS